MAEILDDKASSLVSSTCIGCSSYIGYKQIDWILIQIDGKYYKWLKIFYNFLQKGL